jgi:hypothetical protein
VDRAAATRLKKLLLAAALLAGLYLAGANLFLNTPLGPWAINRRPQKVRVTWDRAWTVLPGDVRVRGLRIDGHSSRVDWWITVERAQGWIDLPALFLRRFRVRGLTGVGVRSSTVRRAVESLDRNPGAPRRPPWQMEMRGIDLTAIRAIGWNGFRLEGKGTARGGFSLILGGDFALDSTALSMPGARLLLHETPVARDLDVRAALSIAPYAPRRHPGVAGWDFLSGTLAAHGKALAPQLLTGGSPHPLPPLPPPLAPSPGEGDDLIVDLRLDHGRLTPGSHASLSAGAAENPLTALLAVEANTAGPRLVLRADARGFNAGRRSDPDHPSAFAADAVHLEAATPETRFSRLLAQGQMLRRTGSLPGGGVLRAAWSAAGLHLAGSGPRLTWQLTADHGSGQIDLPALLHRRILLDDLQADGITVHAERLRRPPPAPPTGQGAWAVRLNDARLTGIREAAFEDLRLDGGLEAAGGLAFDPDGTFALDGLDLRMTAGRLRRGETVLAHGLTLSTAMRVGPYSLRPQPGAGGVDPLDTLSGTVEARGKLAAVPFLTPDRRGRPGSFALDVRLDRGRLAPGTRITVSSGKALEITGAVAAAASQPPRLLLSGKAKGLVLGGGPNYPPLFRAGTATLRTATPELRLRRLFSTAGEIQAGRPAAGEPAAADLEIEGMQAVGVGERIVWQLAADHGRARVDLPALLKLRVVLSGVRIEGAVAQIDPATGPPPVIAPEKRWDVEIRDARVDGIRSLAVQTDRLVGSSRLEGAFTFDRSRRLTVQRVLLEVSGARLESNREPVARGIAVRADFRLAPFEPGKVHGLAMLRLATGTVTVQGQVSSLGFLDRYLRKTPGLEIEGQGRLEADVRLAEGQLAPGSRMDVRSGKVRATFLDSVATGEATVTGTVDRGTLALGVGFSAFEVAPRPIATDAEPPPSYMSGAGLRLGITSTDLDLATPVSDLRATIDLPDGQIPDLSAYNSYLPPGTGVAILSGAGRLRLQFGLNATGQTGEGEVLLTSDTARVRFQDVELAGNLMLRAQLTSRSLKARSFRIAGTRLDFDRVTYREVGADSSPEGAESPGWWAHLQLTDGTMTWSRPLSLQSNVVVEMKNSGFLLSVFGRRKSFPHWFQRLLSIEGVRAEGTVRCGDGAIEISPLRVTGGRFELRSRLRFTRESKQGDLFLRWGKLTTGIELRDGKRTFKLRHPEAWFESGKEPDGPD